MSAPKRGMVAGGPITTANMDGDRKAFEEGYERTFGKDKKPQRGRWRFDEKAGVMVPVDEDWTDAERRAQTATEGIVYGNSVAPDGTDISSRNKRRDYMKREGVADASDFTQHGKQKRKEREEHYSSGRNRKQVTQAVVEAYNRLRKP